MPTTAEKQDETQPAGAEDTGLPARLQASLDDLSVGQLRSVQRYAEAKVRERAESEKAALIEETRRRAEELGLSLRDLFGESATPAPAKRGGSRRVGAKRPSARRWRLSTVLPRARHGQGAAARRSGCRWRRAKATAGTSS